MADDPFDWDVDRVVTEFCTHKRTWKSKTPKLPDPAQFEAILRKNEVDGEVLLTIDDFQEFFRDLGVESIKHKNTLRNAINDLRRRSREYQQNLQEQAASPGLGNDERVNSPEASPEPPPGPSPEPAPKKRRLDMTQMTQISKPDKAQQNISREPDTNGPPADAEISFATPDGDYYNWASGVAPVQMFDETDTTGDPMSLEDLTMHMIPDRPAPFRRILQVNRVLKRHLLRRGRYTRRNKSDAIKRAEDAEEVLPPLGESDEEYDSETLEEMRAEAEEAEQEAHDLINDEQINEVIDEALRQIKLAWDERKLPKLEKNAYSIWQSTRHPGILKSALKREQEDLRHFENRLAKQREDICGQSWDSLSDIKNQTTVLEKTVMDKHTASWNFEMLSSRSAPPKPQRQARAATRRGPGKAKVHKGEEILTSESEDGLDDFIVDVEPMDQSAVDKGPAASPIPTFPMVDGGDDPGPLVQDDIGAESDAAGDSETHTLPPISQPLEMHDDEIEEQTPRARKPQAPAASHGFDDMVIDLTSSPPPEAQSANGPERFDNKPLMPLDDMEGIRRLIAQEIKCLPRVYMEAIFNMVAQLQPDHLWNHTIVPTLQQPFPKVRGSDDKDSFTAFQIVRLFDGWSNKNILPLKHYKRLNDEETQRILALNYKIEESGDTKFARFAKLIKDVSLRFDWDERKLERKPLETESKSPNPDEDDMEEDAEVIEDEDGDEDVEVIIEKHMASKISPQKKNRTHKIDKAAQNMRKNFKARQHEQAERAKAFNANASQISGENKRMVINVSKKDNQGLVYVNDVVAQDIRPHQIEGVRFMWNQITSEQGCLLAHTMGLGKTMQVITLLLALAETSALESDDDCQVPEHLRTSQAVVLCPPGLVTNWLDELYRWAPDSLLGEYIRCDATIKDPRERASAIDKWCEEGGVLIMGHEFFSGKKTLTDDQRYQVTNKASILVVDEAHKMKNPKSRLHLTTLEFNTPSRIALTGSPLANSVLEYHTLINWIAPGYLSNISEFRATYHTPIKEGLQTDSTKGQRSKALKMLRVLTTQVAPLVNRATISAVVDLLPKKLEFILYVPPSPLQKRLYSMYIEYQRSLDSPESRLASLESLRPLLAHPAVFRRGLDDPSKLDKIKVRRDDLDDDEEEDGELNTKTKVTLPPALVSQLKMVLNKNKNQIDNPALSSKIPLLCAILDASKACGDHVLVFCRSIPALDYLEKMCKDQRRTYSRLDGGTSMEKRPDMVKDFNRNPRDLYLISTMAGGVGLNITGANRVVIFDFKFNPQDEQQAIGRAYRIGQKKPVAVYRLVCGGTFEEKLLSQAIFKMQLTSRVIDIKNPIPKAKAFDELFQNVEDPPQTDISEHEGKDNILDNLLHNGNTRGILRKVDMMDTFEEERLEEISKDMTEEDRAEADRLIDLHNRTSGKRPHTEQLPIPTFPATQPMAPPVVHTPTGNGLYHTAPWQYYNHNEPPSTAPPALPYVQEPVTRPAYSPKPGTNGAPLVPIPGASTQYGVGSDRVPLNPKMKGFKGELSRLFDFEPQAPGEIRAYRKKIAADIALAVGSAEPEKYDKIKCNAILVAAESNRFVMAFQTGMLKPADMASMDPGQILETRESSHRPASPPSGSGNRGGGAVANNESRQENPKYRLQRLSAQTATTPAAPGYIGPAVKSHRLDDEQAMEGVLARRSSQQHRAKDPRLPSWAQKGNLNEAANEAAKRKHISPPQSSLSTPIAQTPKQRPSARSPFS